MRNKLQTFLMTICLLVVFLINLISAIIPSLAWVPLMVDAALVVMGVVIGIIYITRYER